MLRRARLRLLSPSGSGRPMSRQELAEAVNAYLWRVHGVRDRLDETDIGKLERGVHRWPGALRREALRAVLGASSDAELGLFIIRRSHTASKNAVEPGEAPGASLEERFPPTADGREEPGTRRRDVTRLIAGLLAGMSAPTMVEAAQPILEGFRRPDDPTILAGYAATAQMLADMYRSADPRTLLPMAAAYADKLLETFAEEPAATRGERPFAAVVVDVHAQVGLWACHTGRLAMALKYLTLAVEVAASIGEPAVRARTLGALSYLYSSAPRGGQGGNPQRALSLLDGATALAGSVDAFTRGWLATWRADQHATLGDLARARADVEVAQACLANASSGPAGFFSRRSYGYGMGLRRARGVRSRFPQTWSRMACRPRPRRTTRPLGIDEHAVRQTRALRTNRIPHRPRHDELRRPPMALVDA